MFNVHQEKEEPRKAHLLQIPCYVENCVDVGVVRKISIYSRNASENQ
jgi:hypothetical protein